LVNGELVKEAPLQDGDQLRLGDCKLEFHWGAVCQREMENAEALKRTESEGSAKGPRGIQATLAALSVEQAINTINVPRLVTFTAGTTREIPLLTDRVTIGRGPENTIQADEPAVSRHHAELQRDGPGFVLRDLGSTNGTWVHEQRVSELRLEHGEAFRVGTACFIYKAAFRREDLGASDTARTAPRASGRRPIVVIPGIMGSELWNGDEIVWPNLRNALRRAQLMQLPDQTLRVGRITRQIVVVPNVVMLKSYNQLVQFLEESLGYRSGVDLLEFPYDWRRDNRESARKLGEAITAWKQQVLGRHAKVTIVAHSMGCLVSRYYVTCLGGAEHVERLIFMGGPHFGAVSAAEAILSGERIFPMGLFARTVQKLVSSYPSCYQLVATTPAVVDMSGQWRTLHEDDRWVSGEQRGLLHDANRFHEEIGRRTGLPTLCIFGYGMSTVTKIAVDSLDAQGWCKARFLVEKSGDGTVTEASARLEGTEIHPVHQYHGALWTDNDVKMRLKLELNR
jgi:pSer/pThr/pTyr-binding forkhead associated (FHA) protein